MPQCPFRLLSRHKATIGLLPYVGAALGCAGLISINTRDAIAAQLATTWSVPAMAIFAGIAVGLFSIAVSSRAGLQTSVMLPRWAQKSIYFGGIALMTTLTAASAITYGVWNDTNNLKIPNRFTAWVSVATQRVLFGDCAALDWIWVLSNNAKACANASEAKYWKDEAEALCCNIPSFNYKRFDYPNGDIVHEFDNTPLGSLTESNFVHEDDSIIMFGDGFVEFPAGFGEAKTIELGEKIRKVHILEKSYGGKEYRFNGARDPQITYNPYDHFIMASLRDGQFFTERDVTTRCLYSNDVAVSLNEDSASPECVIEFPQQNSHMTIKSKPSRIRVIGEPLEHKSLMVWDESGSLVLETHNFPEHKNN